MPSAKRAAPASSAPSAPAAKRAKVAAAAPAKKAAPKPAAAKKAAPKRAAAKKPAAKPSVAAKKPKVPAAKKAAPAKAGEALTAEEEDELVEMLVEEAVSALAANNKASTGAAVQITSSKVRAPAKPYCVDYARQRLRCLLPRRPRHLSRASAAPCSHTFPSAARARPPPPLRAQVCNAFKTRASAVAAAVKAAKPGVSVAVDEQKAEGRNPDRGSFRIAVRGKLIVDLKGMPRPFVAMKALDMDDVCKRVVAAL